MQQNLVIVGHMFLMAFLYMHLYNVCGFTSSVSCMQNEIVESIVKHNGTYQNQRQLTDTLDVSSYLTSNMDILLFRIVAEDPFDRLYHSGQKVE